MKTLQRPGPLLFLVVSLLLPPKSLAAILPGGPLTNIMLDQWSFSGTDWYSDFGFAPVAYTNIANLTNILWIDTGDSEPAYLFYNVVQTGVATNLICSNGTISLWFNPDWSSAGAVTGSTGPQDWANLISLGEYGTSGSSWWAWYLDPNGTNIFFSAQTNGSDASNYLSAPVTFLAGKWYNLVLTYSATNSAFYTNGVQVTNGMGVAYWPGPDVTFFAMGSDSNGFHQLESLLASVQTYNYPLDAFSIAANFSFMSIFYGIASPEGLTNSTPNPPSTAAPVWFTGPGTVQYVGSASCSYSTNVWLTNVFAVYATNGTTTTTFTVAGGSSGAVYDVYGTAELAGKSVTNAQWVWLGQCSACGIYRVTTTNIYTACFMLGTSQDSDSDGLPDAFEALVSKTNPGTAYTYGSLPDAWIALNDLAGNSSIASQDPDQDGLSNWQEYLYGSKPLVPEGTNIWVGSPAGYSGIP